MRAIGSRVAASLILGLAIPGIAAAAGTLPIPEPALPSPEMLAWMDERVPRVGNDEARLDSLLRALVTDPGLALTYDATFTATAREVFAEGRFNCLSFAHLFLGLARSRGIAVEYFEAPVSRYSRDGDLVLAAGHVTVGYDRGVHRRVVRIGASGREELSRAVPISDRRAHALHWSNLGSQRLLEKDLAGAEELLERALALDGALAAAWTSLGVLRRRQGDVRGAEAMYRRAIEADGRHRTAYQNLFSLFVATGRDDAARELEELLVKHDNHNPFAWLALGEFSLSEGRLDEARRLLRRAYRLAPRDPEILAARGTAALAGGKPSRAARWLRRAERLDPGAKKVERLARSLAAE